MILISLLGFNSRKYLDKCLRAVFNQSYKNFKVLYIDNYSKDDSVQWMQKHYPNFEIIKNKQNLGYAGGHNIGIQKAISKNAKYILCLNPDIFLEKNYLQELINITEKNINIASISGKLLKYNWQNKKKTNIIDSAGLKMKLSCQVVDRGRGMQDNTKYDTIEQVFGVSGAAPLYRISALKNIIHNKQAFDNRFFMYKEDVDLAWRLKNADYDAVYVPNARAYHDRTGTGSYFKLPYYIKYYSIRNHLLMLGKNLKLQEIAWRWPFIIAHELQKLLYCLIFERKLLKAYNY
tara:strand:- start:964 stop:1836 length:873 start_codon:yes stop_codon:yes gene_type:complete